MARLLAYAEAPRQGDWSLRSALVRYAQPEPQRASAVLELIRRTDGALHPHARRLERGDAPDADVRALLHIAAELDRLGDVLAAWAADPAQARPDEGIDTIARDVFTRLAELGIPRETRPPRRS